MVPLLGYNTADWMIRRVPTASISRGLSLSRTNRSPVQALRRTASCTASAGREDVRAARTTMIQGAGRLATRSASRMADRAPPPTPTRTGTNRQSWPGRGRGRWAEFRRVTLGCSSASRPPRPCWPSSPCVGWVLALLPPKSAHHRQTYPYS